MPVDGGNPDCGRPNIGVNSLRQPNQV